ncbi:MAG: O-methyltransferase [Desertimonas sp.]
MPTARAHIVDPRLAGYVADHSTPPDEHQRRLIEVTRDRTGDAAGMQIGADQATLFQILTGAMAVTSAIEIGTFTGFSALAIARGLAPGGRLICCDVSEEWTTIARQAWEAAGVADRIDLHVGPALDTLAELGSDERFDLAFVDADKTGYLAYVEALLPRMRPRGVILVDNTLWSGRVAEPAGPDDNANTVALRTFNDTIAARDDVLVTVLPIGDGVTVIQRRP